eukprot:COSAG02_NODE_67530_length_252_cov_2.032680_1_plen_40_part_01
MRSSQVNEKYWSRQLNFTASLAQRAAVFRCDHHNDWFTCP